MEMQNVYIFDWVKYTMRVITEEGKERFFGFLTNIDWVALLSPYICPDINTDLMHEKIDRLFCKGALFRGKGSPPVLE